LAKDIPADEASEQVASCAAAMGIAVGAGAENSIRCSGPEPEIDGGDDDSSPVPGRSFDQDVRIAIHEAGHESRRLNFVGALTGGSESWRLPVFSQNVITRMPHRLHTLRQIGWSNQ
jgi:hypothetical protein